ncbi:large ribosomal subunit protein mL41-like [Amphiura filiformis]|uniref:large ribosomal subunit protein mL41-like n=1 Tax=Amphiura filiformis TaxID=82378 RepID=UPI003B227BD9
MPGLGNVIRGLARGANRHKEMTGKRGNKDFQPKLGAVETGRFIKGKWVNIKEMIPEFVVPDLQDFELQPYVSLKCPDVENKPLTAKEIFDACVAPTVEADFKAGKYDNDIQNQSSIQSS